MNTNTTSEYRKEAWRIEQDSLYSCRGHYNASESWASVHLWIGIPNAVLATIAGVSAFEGNELVAGILAIVVAAITAIFTFLNPGDRASIHNRCAGEYHSLRNRARIFVNIESKRSSSEDEMSLKFEALAAKRDSLNASSPQIPRRAYEKAKKSIEAGEAQYEES